MTQTASEIMEFVRENDIKFIRLGFCDPQGNQKNIAVMPGTLRAAFEEGVNFDASAIPGFADVTRSDLQLVPDPATLAVLPWRPETGRVARFYCDIRNPDGTAYAQDGRYLLKQVAAKCERMGYVCKIGAECEFYLFRTDENGEPTDQTLDRGGYLDISPLDKAENIRREICLCLEEMGIEPEASHHEQGPGQNEIVFRFSDALQSADNLMTFKSVVKAVAARNGLFASFMPKPIPGASGSGLHVNLSLARNGLNIFRARQEGHSRAAEHFIAGILQRTPEITLFLNPIYNSYDRLGRMEAPGHASWSHHNRSQLIRIPAAIGDKMRMELRSPDPAVNPYIAFALIIAAGLSGIENELPLPPPLDADLYAAPRAVLEGLSALPTTLEAAIQRAENSNFVRETMDPEMLARYLAMKRAEAAEFAAAADREKLSRERYFAVC